MTLLDTSWDRDRWQRELAEVERELERQAGAEPRKPQAAPLRGDVSEDRWPAFLRWWLP